MPVFADAMFAQSDYVRMYLPSILLLLLIAVLLVTAALAIVFAIRKKKNGK